MDETFQVVAFVFVLIPLVVEPQRASSHTEVTRSQPAFTNQHPNVYIFESDENGNRLNLNLPCPIDSPSLTVNYTWFRGDQELPRSMVNEEGNLIIPNITEGEYASREGVNYYCIASDNIGYSVAVRSRNVTVYYAYFDGFERMSALDNSMIEVPIPVALNSDVALECDVLNANPPPQIKWYDDHGEIREIQLSNRVRFLDDGHYLYLRRLQPTHLERQYYCAVTNVNLSQEVSAPTRYVLTDNLTQGVLMDYKQIGNLRAFVGNTSIEFAFIGGVFGDHRNETINILYVNGGEVPTLGNIGIIDRISVSGMVRLEAIVRYNHLNAMRSGIMTVYQVPRITNAIQDEREHFVGEENLTCICHFEGIPLPNIMFYFNGANISPESGVTIVNNTLIIPSPQVSHSGTYQCIVSNEFGDDQAAWLLEIRQPTIPQVQWHNYAELNAVDDRDLGTLIVMNSGSVVSLSIDVVADPCPDVAWTFNGTALELNNYYNIIYNNPCTQAGDRNFTWTYTLNVVLTPETSGQYLANFTNIAGISFLPKAYLTIPKPVYILGLSLNETCLKEGSDISIRCNIKGFPRPNIEFRKNDAEIASEEGLFQNILIEFYDQIVIKNVTMDDEGIYSCTASNVMGNQPQVTQKFDFCTMPRIIHVDVTPNPHTGEFFFIECTADGIPVPITTWMKDGEPFEEIQNDHRIRIIAIPARRSSRVEFSEASVDDNGVYQCIISNDAGSIMHSFIVELMQAGGSDVVSSVPPISAPLSPGLTVSIAVGVTVFISAALLVVLVLVCVICRLCVNDKSSKPQIAGTYSANVAYTGTLEHLRQQSEAIYPLYDTIPYSDPAQLRTNKRPHIYEKIYEDNNIIQLTEQPTKNTTVNDDKDKHTDITETSHDEDNRKRKSPKNQSEIEQETTLHLDLLTCTRSKHPVSEYIEGSIIKEVNKAEIKHVDEQHKDVEVGREHTQMYTSISAEHKAKKRVKILQKHQKEELESERMKQETIEKESKGDEKHMVNLSEERKSQDPRKCKT